MKGIVRDNYGDILPGASVHIGAITTWTNEQGEYTLNFEKQLQGELEVCLTGFQRYTTYIDIKENGYQDFTLNLEDSLLEDIIISSHYTDTGVSNSQVVSASSVQKNFQGSLAKSLENLPGVSSLDIGAGGSKPIIRGLGFNRLVVAQNGSKQEGQQWGADHGLEIDAFANEKVTIVKGVGTILYGSDAIGGVIRLDNEQIPQKNSFSGNVHLLAQSVNDSYGGAFQVKARKDKFFFKTTISGFDYASYRVPTDHITYSGTKIPLAGNRVENSAGKKLSFSAQVGYVESKWQNILTISNYYDKSGFFPGSHAIDEMISGGGSGNFRSIAMPSQGVNHFKVVDNWTYFIDSNTTLKVMGSFQNNLRRERNPYHSHVGGEETDIKDPTLELEFDLSTFETSVVLEHLTRDSHMSKIGASYFYNNNTIGGYGFLMPEYNKKNLALFATQEYMVNASLILEAGIRWEMSSLNISSYFDQNLYNYLLAQGNDQQTAQMYGQRSIAFDKTYHSFNGMVGMKYQWTPDLELGATVGSTFRFPTPMELGSNGVHHGAYRFERGDLNLDPEKGFAFDVQLKLDKQDWYVAFSPYLYYFSNYIYLKPSGEFSVVPDSGQIYQYSQDRALLNGFELEMKFSLVKNIELHSILEYTYTQLVTKNKKTDYPLAMSTPLNFYTQVKYEFRDFKFFRDNSWFVDGKWFARQNRIAQGEMVTPSSVSIATGVNTKINLGSFYLDTSLSVLNLFNAKNFSHTSFYRTLDIPQPGRSVQLNVRIPF